MLLFDFQCPYFEQQKGVRADNTIHIFTHFIRRIENAIRDYLQGFLLSRLDYVLKIGEKYLINIGSSAEAYIDAVSTPDIPLDLLGILLISHLYQFHVAVAHSRGVWCTSNDNDILKAMFVLVLRGDNYTETCHLGQSEKYLQSLADKTAAGLMPSHMEEIKINIQDDTPSTDALQS